MHPSFSRSVAKLPATASSSASNVVALRTPAANPSETRSGPSVPELVQTSTAAQARAQRVSPGSALAQLKAFAPRMTPAQRRSVELFDELLRQRGPLPRACDVVDAADNAWASQSPERGPEAGEGRDSNGFLRVLKLPPD